MPDGNVFAPALAGADNLSVTAAALGLATVVYAVPAALTWPRAVPSLPVLGALAGLPFTPLIAAAFAAILTGSVLATRRGTGISPLATQ